MNESWPMGKSSRTQFSTADLMNVFVFWEVNFSRFITNGENGQLLTEQTPTGWHKCGSSWSPKEGRPFLIFAGSSAFFLYGKILKVCLLPTCRVSKAIQGLGAGENFPFHWLPATGRAWPMAASVFNKNPLHRTNRLDDVIPSIWPSQIFPYSPFTNFLRSIWITN